MSATLTAPLKPIARAKPVCRHCGAASPSAEFCCAGCAYVYRLVHESGLDTYYKLKDAITPPAALALSPARNFYWLKVAQEAAEASARERKQTPELLLDVQGISCAGCVWLIERVFQRQAGAGRIELNAQTGQVRLSWAVGAFQAEAFAEELQRFNYLLGPATAARSAAPESRGLVRRIGLTAAFAMNIMLFALPSYFGMESTHVYAPLFASLSLGFATLSVLVGGSYFFSRAAASLRAGIMSIDLPIALGIVGAYGGSFAGWMLGREEYVYFDFVGTFVVLMLTGRWAQVAAVERNQRQLLGQQPVGAPIAVRLTDGRREQRLPHEVKKGDVYFLNTGQTVPVESVLQSEAVEVSLAWINGESAPKVLRRGQRLPAGATLLSRAEAEVVAQSEWDHSLLAELLRPTSREGYRHRFIERVIQGYLIGILLIATASGAFWIWSSGDLMKTGAVVTAVLVVSCPCAIGLAFPLADEMATVFLRRRGVFVRAHDLWPRLARIRSILFDKTGTLTLETPTLAPEIDLSVLAPTAQEALFTLVHENPHPAARAIADRMTEQGGLSAWPLESAEDVGQGVSLQHEGVLWTLGRPGWRGIHSSNTKSEMIFAREGVVLADFWFQERLRPGARAELDALRARGLGVNILSGDRREKVVGLARSLGLAEKAVAAELTPQEKAQAVAAAGAETSLMLGDGANDSLAFDRALCRGTPVIHRGVLEQKADFYYLGNSIAGIRLLFEVDAIRRRTQSWLLIFSVGYNLLAVGLAVTGHMNPLLAAILMPLSSLVSLAIVGAGMRPAHAATVALPAAESRAE